jgi:hypothetical protein
LTSTSGKEKGYERKRFVNCTEMVFPSLDSASLVE